MDKNNFVDSLNEEQVLCFYFIINKYEKKISDLKKRIKKGEKE